MHKTFKKYDTNYDGKLSKSEIQAAYKQYKGKNLSQKEVDDLFAQIDDDDNGTISYTGFNTFTLFSRYLRIFNGCHV